MNFYLTALGNDDNNNASPLFRNASSAIRAIVIYRAQVIAKIMSYERAFTRFYFSYLALGKSRDGEEANGKRCTSVSRAENIDDFPPEG